MMIGFVPPLKSDADIINLPPDTNSNGSSPFVPFILSTNSKLPTLLRSCNMRLTNLVCLRLMLFLL